METRQQLQKSIGFQVIECSRCGARRVLGQPCAECSLKPRSGEVNALVVQRCTTVARIQEALTRPSTVPKQTELGIPSHEELVEYLENFAIALGGITEAPVSQESIAAIVKTEQQLQDLKHRSSTQPRLRPNIAQHEAVAKILAHFSELWPTYAKALQAPDLGQAQRLADQGQSQIDAASEVVAKHARMVEATRAYEDAATPDLLERSINALTLSFPGLDLRSLDRLGAQEAERLIGIPAEVGLGAHFLILDSVSSAHFDPERFHTLLRETSRLCSDDSRLSVVASQSDALEGLATSSRLVYEAWEVFESTLLRIRDDDTLMRRTIKFYGDFYEDVAGAFLAWYNLVAGVKEKPYAKLIQLDTTELARSLSRQERTAFLLQDDGASLRNASQHGNSFTLDGDKVIFKLRSYEGTLSRAEVIDRIFSFVESILAMSWSLLNALARLDIEVPLKANDAAYMNLTPFRLATLWLESDASNLVDAKETATAWEFTMAIDQHEVAPMALTFAQKLPEDVTAVSVRTPSSHTSLIVPFAAYERFHAAQDAALEPVHQVMALVVFRSECMVNGKAIVTPSDLMYTVATIGLPLLQKDDLSLIPLLRTVYSLTISHSVPDITRVVKGVFEATRTPGAVRGLKLKATLTDWMNGPAPTFPGQVPGSGVAILR